VVGRGVEGGRAKTDAESGKRRHRYGLGATVRAHVRRVSEEPHPVRWPGVAVAVQKVASSMKIAARKTNARGFCGSAGKRAKSTYE